MLVSRLKPFGGAACVSCARRLGYWWGHTTKEEIEAEEKKRQDGPIMAWQNPESDLIGIEKTASYVPARVLREESATRTTYDLKRFYYADYYGFVNHPHGIYGYIRHPEHYFPNMRIREYQKLVGCQKFIKDRLVALGPDLAAATFLLSRNCRVKFKDRSGGEFVSLQGMLQSKQTLPTSWQSGWYVEAIDASCSDIVYEGFNNMRNLIFLKSLDLSYCPQIDDWCMDRITGEFQDSLEELDVSGCKMVKLSGLESIWRLRKLKVLKLRHMDHIDSTSLNLLCLMLMEELPDLQIVGVDYEDTKVLLGTEDEHLIGDYESMLLNPGSSTQEEKGEPQLSPPLPFVGVESDSVKDPSTDQDSEKVNQQN